MNYRHAWVYTGLKTVGPRGAVIFWDRCKHCQQLSNSRGVRPERPCSRPRSPEAADYVRYLLGRPKVAVGVPLPPEPIPMPEPEQRRA